MKKTKSSWITISVAVGLFFTLVLVNSIPTIAQRETVLTNSDISQMLQSKVSESTILRVIETSPNQFDTSPEALLKLKKQGASQSLLDNLTLAKIRFASVGKFSTSPRTTQLCMSEILNHASEIKAQTCDPPSATVNDCHDKYPTGCSLRGGYDAYLCFLKNRVSFPECDQKTGFVLSEKFIPKLEEELPQGLNPLNHAEYARPLADLGEGLVLSLVGYVYFAIPGGKSEATNCRMSSENAIDYHIGLGFKPFPVSENSRDKLRQGTDVRELPLNEAKPLEQNSFVVEMTPHYRTNVKPSWTLAKVQTYVGYQVKVIGQLLADNDHFNSQDDCSFPKADENKCWRKTIWEFHPVLEFYVNQTSQPLPPDSPLWKKLEDLP